MIQNKGTKIELTKYMIVSYSTTPKSCLKQFFNMKAYTIKVISAVVKNRPKQYFKQNENWNLYVVLCLYISVNLWNKFAITNLLNKTTNEIMAKTIAYALI